MSTNYGVLSQVVAISGSLIAASYAIRLAWMRRAKWMPPTETVADATAKTSALICAVIVALLHVFGRDFGMANLAMFAVTLLVLLLIALSVSIYVNRAFSVTKPTYQGKTKVGDVRMLGGFVLMPEAQSISKTKEMGHQELFDNANHQREKVWTASSQAALELVSTLGFIMLQVCGSLALATVALIIAIKSA